MNDMNCPKCGYDLSYMPEDSIIDRYCPNCSELVMKGRGEHKEMVETNRLRNKRNQTEFSKLRKEMEYFECKVPSGDGLCSDDNCPCPQTVIPHGTGYLYIPQSIVDFRRKYPTQNSAIEATQLGTIDQSLSFLGGGFMFISIDPTLVCEQGAKLRNLDLEIAAADANYMWKNGKAPLRATPLTGSKEAERERERMGLITRIKQPKEILNESQKTTKKWWQFWKQMA